MEMMETVALFDYTARTNQELSFKINQIIFISKQINHQWWFGCIPDKNKSGFIPDGYIKFKSKRRDSIPIQRLISSNNKLDLPLVDKSINVHDNSSSHPTLCRDIHVNQSEIDAPDLVLNLPISNELLTPSSSKSFDETIPIIHSTIIIDLKETKKPMQVIKHLSLHQQSISICSSSITTEV